MKKTVLFVALAFVSTFTQGQVTNGLTAQYSFNNENANDEIGNVNATVKGAILATDRFGNANQAYSVSPGTYLALPDAPSLKSANMSVSLWIKINGFGPSTFNQNPIYSIVNRTVGAYFGAFYMSITPAGKFFAVSQNSPSESVSNYSSSTYNSNWQHLVLTNDFDSLKFYVDGEKQISMFKGFKTTYSTDSIFIGKTGNTDFIGTLNGLVDDIKVYNRALTISEVLSLKNETIASIENEVSESALTIYPNPTAGLIHFSDTYNVVLYDITGNLVSEKQNTSLIDLTEQPAGMYFLVMKNKEGRLIQQQKISKE